MKHLLILTIALMFIVGCGEKEQPLVPNEEPETVGGQASEGEIPTIVIQIPHGGGLPIRTTNPNTTMKVFVVENDLLIQKEAVFQERLYYLLKPSTVDGVPVNEQKNHGRTFVNVLDNKIRDLTSEDEAQIAEKYRKELGIGKDVPLRIDQRVELGARFAHNTPIDFGDELEVRIKHRFKYKENPEFINREPDEIIFVDVIRNLTRPHIVFQ